MRTKFVDEYITGAVFELMKEKELSAITVSEIIKKAGVCRSSFYRNYFLVEDVIKRCLEAMFDIILTAHPIGQGTLEDHIRATFVDLLKAKEKLTILARQNLLHLLDSTMLDVCQKQTLQYFGISDKYSICMWAGSSAFLLRCWIYNNFDKTPDEMAKISMAHIYETKKPV